MGRAERVVGINNNTRAFDKKRSWNNCNKVLVIPRGGRVVTNYISQQKVCLVHSINIQKYGSDHFYPFKIASKVFPKAERLRNHSDQSEDVL